MEAPTLYIIDASSLMVLARNRPAKRHVRIWQRLDGLIRNDRLISPDEVFDEICAGDDALKIWARRYKKERRLFRRTTRSIAGEAKQLMARFSDLIELDRPVPQADPFVVALAAAELREMFHPPIAVVTEEKFAFSGRPRIPNVCGYCKVPYLSIHQLFVNEGWSFGA